MPVPVDEDYETGYVTSEFIDMWNCTVPSGASGNASSVVPKKTRMPERQVSWDQCKKKTRRHLFLATEEGSPSLTSFFFKEILKETYIYIRIYLCKAKETLIPTLA